MWFMKKLVWISQCFYTKISLLFHPSFCKCFKSLHKVPGHTLEGTLTSPLILVLGSYFSDLYFINSVDVVFGFLALFFFLLLALFLKHS